MFLMLPPRSDLVFESANSRISQFDDGFLLQPYARVRVTRVSKSPSVVHAKKLEVPNIFHISLNRSIPHSSVYTFILDPLC